MALPSIHAVRLTTTTLTLALMLAASPAHAQAAPQGSASSKDADIDAFLNDLQRKNDAARAVAPAPQGAVTDPTQMPTRIPARRPARSTGVIESVPDVLSAPAVEYNRPVLLPDDARPFSTLLLMLGGIAICALATVGLTLTFFALRKDIRRKRRSRQRRFIPYPPKKSAPVGQP